MSELGHDSEEQARAGSGPAPKSRLSRRRVMTASAVAAGLGLASASAQAEAATGGQAVSLGPSGTTTVEFRGRVTQSGSTGQSFISYGYLIRASNADDSGLFSGTPLSEKTALLTAYATGDLQARTVDTSVTRACRSPVAYAVSSAVVSLWDVLANRSLSPALLARMR